jgi:hypothetical protein
MPNKIYFEPGFGTGSRSNSELQIEFTAFKILNWILALIRNWDLKTGILKPN